MGTVSSKTVERKTEKIQLTDGVIVYFIQDGKTIATLSFANVVDARIVERVWNDSIPVPKPIQQTPLFGG